MDCRGLRKRVGARCVVVVGGADKEAQVAALQQSPQLVVATPGRLLELLEERVLRLGDHSLLAALASLRGR